MKLNISAVLLAIALTFIGASYFFQAERKVYTFPELPNRYVVTIQESGTRLGIFGTHPRYSLSISRQKEKHGHEIDISLFNSNDDVLTYLKNSSVSNVTGGISFVQSSGHTLFIPNEAFEGGR
ncbi:hypothetical protein [Massilia sp. BJB1822]|uniref:hypothetical protein n=1 Tax=Massilia sp. BJB1822 TaxID=2744470 RepID=UPI001592D970|nr:hypothetical protein [Massilia sp. BJB1822]NVD96974.1 hypothetical protein [Massilia sp. BJB1822]